MMSYFMDAQKGGTAAVYHGLTNNYKIVAVDPILNDEHYINNKMIYI